MDNTTVNPGAGGDTFAADEIGGIKFPRSKLVHGADGVNDGDVSTANPFPARLYNGAGDPLGTELNPVVVQAPAGGIEVLGGATETTLQSVLEAVDNVNTSIGGIGVGGDASEATLASRLSQADFDTKMAALMAVLPAALVSGRLDVNIGAGTLTIQDGGGSVTVDGSVSLSGTPTVDTELPAAAALADATANPTVPSVGVQLMVFNGATWDRLRAAATRKDQNGVAIGTIATVWTPASGKKIRLMGGCLSVSGAASVLFEDNAAGTTVFRTPKLAADTPYNFDLGQGVLLSAANNVLKATASAAGNLTGTLYGCEE